MAERLFRARVSPASRAVASSAGVNALVGHSMDGPSAQILRQLGGDPEGHRGQWLDVPLIVAADLILTAEVSHRSVVMKSEPLAFRRTFTLREFGRLGAGLGPLAGSPTVQELRTRVSAVAEQRGAVEPPRPGDDDIADPFGGPIEEARLVGSRVSAAVDAIIAVLGLARDPGGEIAR
jgi:protein-tyrosine phosphatase